MVIETQKQRLPGQKPTKGLLPELKPVDVGKGPEGSPQEGAEKSMFPVTPPRAMSPPARRQAAQACGPIPSWSRAMWTRKKRCSWGVKIREHREGESFLSSEHEEEQRASTDSASLDTKHCENSFT